jgi:hypothetical protein
LNVRGMSKWNAARIIQRNKWAKEDAAKKVGDGIKLCNGGKGVVRGIKTRQTK